MACGLGSGHCELWVCTGFCAAAVLLLCFGPRLNVERQQAAIGHSRARNSSWRRADTVTERSGPACNGRSLLEQWPRQMGAEAPRLHAGEREALPAPLV